MKNGGQSKEFKENVEKMIRFYEKLMKDCQMPQMDESRMSVASRPDTPIMKLNDISHNVKNNIFAAGKDNTKKNGSN